MEWLVTLVLFGSFFLLLVLGIPISFAIGLSALISIMMMLPFDPALSVVSQKMASGLDSFTLLAIPFFILAGNIMNRGGIAIRLIEFSKLIVGPMPGALGHVNVIANMLFGSISGSAVAAAAAVGGTMAPLQKKNGYDPVYCTAVNVTSCPAGLLIPPSNALIVYSLISGGTSIAALFLAGYIPGLLMGLGIIVISSIIAKKRKYPVSDRVPFHDALIITLRALPSLGLIVVIMGGIVAGVFTATEASAVAVLYTLLLALVFYREVSIKDMPKIILEAVMTSSMIMLLIGASMAMAWAMANADIPYMISNTLLAISDNPIVILLIINIILLVVGVFMDMTPALLIFTPIFLPVSSEIGMDPVHFGIMMVFNLCIGLCTPPVGSALFVGCSVSGVQIDKIIKPLLPFFLILLVSLFVVTFFPQVSLFLPQLLLDY
ncbi:TRAP transporter large permease [Halomonas sp. EGI 63088]|uniref:TRAP transporter large permease protein n=1 Tax=Halomonas flagellata TaxID=2920385 RepID=A0ABS9S061_9GAMM|nr:TRAP transporter large permease [Halomonas flagellata]MCH4565482.1 TRAP transporter large permease [Halomonas flagellata]